MGFFLLLRGHWQALGVVGILLTTFFCGWHLRGLQEVVAKERLLQAQAQANKELQDYYNKESTDYEKRIFNLNKQALDLNQQLKVTYADNAYKCAIPVSGLRILSEASR